MRSYLRGQVALPEGDDARALAPLLGVLRQVELFEGLPRQDLLQIARSCREVVFSQGEMIVEENTPGYELFIITHGSVEIMIDPHLLNPATVSSQPTVIATLWPGQVFGEIGLVDQGMRSASARAAVDDTRLQALNRAYLLGLCDADPQFGYRLMRNIATALAYKIRNTDLILRQRILWAATNAAGPRGPLHTD